MSRPRPRLRRRRRPGSLRSRLAAVLAVTVVLVVLVVSGATYYVTEHQLERGQDVALIREATRIQRLLQAGTPYVASGSDACRYSSEPACTRIVTDSDPIETSGPALRITSAVRSVAQGRLSQSFFTVSTSNGRVRVVVLPIRPGEAVMVGIPTATIDTTVARLRFVLLLVGFIGICLSAIIGYLVATLGLLPVRRLAESVDRVSRSRDPRDGVAFGRDDTGRDDELGRLTRAISAMLGELDASNQAQRQLVADASHELRSPLTTVKTNIALLRRGAEISDDTRRRLGDAVDRELAEMQNLIVDLVDLARPSESPRSGASDEVAAAPLDPVVLEAAAAAGRHWPLVAFRVEGSDPTRLYLVGTSHTRARRLVSVLLDNAGKYSVHGGPVDVALERADDSVVLTVADRGVGIHPDDLPHVFERFFRSPSARKLPGSGLGLAIAGQIVEEAGGTIRAEHRDGGGTMITVWLPSAEENATA